MSARKSFTDFGLPESVVTSLARQGITEAFPIQSLAIPAALAGKDVCGRAPTGSGKTLAFGIPLAQRVTRARSGRPKALILTPTRELAAQIRAEMLPLLKANNHSVATFYGGVGFGPQLKALRSGVEVAVACPGRLMDLVNRGNFKLEEVEFVVIDEADRMADMGFLPEVRRILDQVRSDRQTLLFSATLDGDVDVLIQRYQQDPVTCDVAPDESDGERTTHEFVRTRREDRVGLAAELVTRHGSTVVFCRTKHGTDRVAKQLQSIGVSAVPIHGGRSQAQRDRALASFASRRSQALVATDVAARGIHVDNVGCVVHFDVPGDHKDYVHRSGRTGRAGADGMVVSFVTESDVAKVRQLQKLLKMPLLQGSSSRGDNDGSSRSNGRSGSSRSNGSSGGEQRGRRGSGGGGNRNRYRGGGNRKRSDNRNSRNGGGEHRGSRSSGGQGGRAKQNAR